MSPSENSPACQQNTSESANKHQMNSIKLSKKLIKKATLWLQVAKGETISAWLPDMLSPLLML